MANNKFTVVVDVTDNGKLKQTSDSVRTLGKEAANTSGASKDLFNTMEKGVVGVANSTKSFSKLAQTVQGSSGVVGAYATLAANAFAVHAAFEQLKGAAQLEQVFRGLSSAGARSGQALDVVANQLREVTANTIDLRQAYTATARTFAAGFSTKQILAIGQAANDASYALGENETETLSRIVSGVEKLRPQLLAQIGIFTTVDESSANYARQLGKTVTALSGVEKRQGYLNAVLDEAKLKFGGLSDEAGDSRVYNQLGATTTNLKNSVLGLINTAIVPFVNLIGSSPTALGGAALIFASTISGKLLPGIDGMKKRTDAAVETSLKHVSALKAEQSALEATALAARANVDVASQRIAPVTGGNSKYNAMEAAIHAGTARAQAGIDTLSRSMNVLQGQYIKILATDPDSPKLAAKEALINATYEQIDALKALQLAETAEFETQAAQAQAELENRYKINAALSESAALQTSSAALGAAATGKYGDAIKNLGKTISNYRNVVASEEALERVKPERGSEAYIAAQAAAKELEKSQVPMAELIKQPLSLAGNFKVAGVAIAQTARVIGTAFLNAIPVIGQIIFAIGLVKAAIDYLTPKSVKDLAKAYEDFGAIVIDVDKSIESFNRLQTSNANVTLRTEQALATQSNAIRTLVEAYDDVIAKQIAYDKVKKDSAASGVATAFQAFLHNDAESIASYETGLDRASKAVQAGKDKLGGTVFGGQDKGVKAAIDTLGRLEVLAPEVTKKFVDLNGGWQKLTDTDAKTFIASVRGIADGVNDNYKAAADNVKDLTDSFKNLDQSITDWAQAAKVSTPFDKVVDNFRAVNNAIDKFQETSAKLGTHDADQYKNLLANIGTASSSMLDPATKTKLDAFNASNDQVQQIKSAISSSSGDELIGLDRALANANAQVVAQSSILDTVKLELAEREKNFETAQMQTREYKSQEAAIQAVLSANTANDAATASGVEARLKGENAIKELQISELRVNEALLKTYIAQQEASIQKLKTEVESIENNLHLNGILSQQELIQRRQLATLKENNAVAALNRQADAARQDAEAAAKRQGLSDEAAAKAGAAAAAKIPSAVAVLANPAYSVSGPYKDIVTQLKAAQTEATGLQKAIDDNDAIKVANQQIEAYKSSINTIVDQIKAISISESTSAQISAEAAAKRNELINQQTQQLAEQLKIVQAMQTTETATNRLLEGRTATLADQLSDLQDASVAAKTQLDATHDNAVRTLQSERQKAIADASKASGDPAQVAANKDRLALLDEQLRIENQSYTINSQNLDVSLRNNIAQKVAFDTQSAGLTMQKDALTYLEKQLSARKELIDSALELGVLDREISRRRVGSAQNDYSKKNDEVAAALAAYNYAVDEAGLKVTTIKLEYALLAAQRQTSLANLETQKAGLIASGAANSDMVKQLDATIDGLKKAAGYIDSAQQDSLALVNKQIEVAYKKYQVAALPEGTQTRVVDILRDYDRSRQATRDAVRDVNKRETPKASEPVVAPLVKSTQDLNLTTLKAVDVEQELVNVMRQLVEKQKGLESGTNATLGKISLSDSVSATMKQIINFFTGKGYSLAQAAGIAGNLKQESGLDPHKVNTVSGNAGLAQLSKANQAIFEKEFGHSVIKSTVEEQLQFINEQLNGTEGAAKRLLQAATSVSEAAIAFRKGYERPGEREANDNARVKFASSAVKPVIASSAAVPMDSAMPANDNDVVVAAAKRTKPIDILGGVEKKLDLTKLDVELPDFNALIKPDKVLEPYQNEIIDKLKIITSTGSESILSVFSGMADALGPQGKIVPILIEGVNSFGAAFENIKNAFNETGPGSTAKKFAAIADAAQAAISTVQSALAASAAAKEDAIQREIDAETKRDGKSVESVAKLDALNKQKDSIARKAFNTNKKMMMAQAIIATATGVAQALTLGPIAGPILAAAIGAMGLAEVAIISGTQYESSYTPAAAATPSTLTIGKQGDSIDLAHQNTNVGGEIGYLRGAQGTGTNSSNYSVIGSAYGGNLPRGYGNTAYVVGEKGPETIVPMTPMTVQPANDNSSMAPINATVNIHAIDARGVEDVLHDQKGNLISMFREAANANGQPFMENVNVTAYSRPNRTGSSRL